MPTSSDGRDGRQWWGCVEQDDKVAVLWFYKSGRAEGGAEAQYSFTCRFWGGPFLGKTKKARNTVRVVACGIKFFSEKVDRKKGADLRY